MGRKPKKSKQQDPKPTKIGDFVITPSEERKKKIDNIIYERRNKIDDFLNDVCSENS